MKATHIGTCQICGRTQALPNGKIAKHGYNVRWGFFNGTCVGSGHLPFEQSRGELMAMVITQTARVDQTLEHIAALRDPKHPFNTGSRVTVYSAGAWRTADITHTTYDGVRATVYFVEPLGRREFTRTLFVKPEDVVTHLNYKRAIHLSGWAKNLQGWISDAQSRLSTWALKPLTERGYIPPTVAKAKSSRAAKTQLRKEIASLKRDFEKLTSQINPVILSARNARGEQISGSVWELYYDQSYANQVATLVRRYEAAVKQWPELASLQQLIDSCVRFAEQIKTLNTSNL